MGAGGIGWCYYFRCTSTHTLNKICALLCMSQVHIARLINAYVIKGDNKYGYNYPILANYARSQK